MEDLGESFDTRGVDAAGIFQRVDIRPQSSSQLQDRGETLISKAISKKVKRTVVRPVSRVCLSGDSTGTRMAPIAFHLYSSSIPT